MTNTKFYVLFRQDLSTSDESGDELTRIFRSREQAEAHLEALIMEVSEKFESVADEAFIRNMYGEQYVILEAIL